MAFDPDAFLAEEDQPVAPQAQPQPATQPEQAAAEPDFDPDAYLQEDMPTGSAMDVVWEPVQQMIGGAAGMTGGGIAGAMATPFLGAERGAGIVESGMQAGAEWGAPETQRGTAATKKFNQFMGDFAELLRTPVAGIGGLTELVFSGGDIDSAIETMNNIKTQGVGPVLGDKVFESTESPLLASMAYVSPDAVLSAGGFKSGVQPASRAYQRRQTRLQQELAADIVNLPEGQSKAGQQFTEGGQRVPVPRERQLATEAELLAMEPEKAATIRAEQARRIAAEDAARRMGIGGAKVRMDPDAQRAIDVGWDPGVVASIKAAAPDDWRNMKQSLQRWKDAKEVARMGIERRPSDLAGDALQRRVLHLDKVKNDAGRQLGAITDGLRGTRVDLIEPVRKFGTRLMDMGIEIRMNGGGKLSVDFSGSDIEFSPGAKRIIKNIFTRMNEGRPIDAFEAHRFKKMIDEQVNYGKSLPGYAGTADRMIKNFRTGINNSIRDVSPEYAKANEVFSESITAIDNLQDAVGKRVDLTGAQGATQLGQELRKIMSNYNTRSDIHTNANEVSRLANKYGGGFVDDPMTQIMFTDEMARAIGTPAERRAFETLIARGTKTGIEAATGGPGIMSEILMPAYDKLVGSRGGRTPEGRVQAMEDLLDSLLATEGAP